MEVHDHADVVVALLVLTDHFLVVGVHQEGQHGTRSTPREGSMT